jgi:hypothetical protein
MTLPPEVSMTTAFKEFSKTYEQFKKEFPRHPLTEELRNRLVKGKFPSDQWLVTNTERMKDLMEPVWLRTTGTATRAEPPAESPDAAA